MIDKVVFGHRLHSVILEVFSNLIDSVILSAGCSHGAQSAAGRAARQWCPRVGGSSADGVSPGWGRGAESPPPLLLMLGDQPRVQGECSGLQMHVSVQLLIHQHPQVLPRAALKPFCVYSLLWLSGFWHMKHG